MLREPTLEPGVDGVYVTLITQVVVGWSGTEQLFVAAKSPLAAIAEITSVVVPLFVTVTV
jgi:hypothetical protein